MSETFTVNGLTVKIEQEEYAQSPQEDMDTGLFLVANHRSFYVPEPGEKRIPDSANEVVDKYKKTHWVFPLEAYIHSGVRLALSGEGNFPDRQFDVSQLGFVFASKKEWRIQKSARKAALSLVERWNQYLSGDVWDWQVLDAEGKQLDSCGGCYGLEYAKGEATASAKFHSECEVLDCTNIAIGEANFSINNAPSKSCRLCQVHLDAAGEDNAKQKI